MDLHSAVHATNLMPAYLDGGTGAMMFQAAVAGLVSVAFVARTRWSQLKAFVASKVKSGHSTSR